MEQDVDKVGRGELEGTYGAETTQWFARVVASLPSLPTVKRSVGGANALVVGTEEPWVEAILLAAGVRRVTTVEFAAVEVSHPQMDAMTPRELSERVRSGGVDDEFDVAVSFSSVEHAGLGRYGDALAPWGDVVALARLWCLVREGGLLVLAVPWAFDGRDHVLFNANRVYGAARASLVLTGWEPLHLEWGFSVEHMVVVARRWSSSS